MTRFTWTITIRSAIKVDFVDSFQHHHDRALDKFVLHTGDPKRSRLPIPFRDVLTQAWLRSIAAAVKSLQQVPQVIPQVLAVLLQPDAVDTGSFTFLELAEGFKQQLEIKQRKQVIENRFRVAFGSLRDAIQPG